MKEVKIDVIGPEPTQRTFHRAQDILSPIATAIWIGRIGIESEFRRDDRAIARFAISDELPEPAFAGAAGVQVGGVEEISASVEVGIENLFGAGPSPIRCRRSWSPAPAG